jgi:hypothetical protein
VASAQLEFVGFSTTNPGELRSVSQLQILTVRRVRIHAYNRFTDFEGDE